MRLRQAAILVIAIGLSGLTPQQAVAKKLCFGTDEQLVHVQNLTAKGPKGEPLALARKLSRQCFVAPYTISDDGFVLQIVGENLFYPLGPELVTRMQASGELPRPLPSYQIDWVEWTFGHLLWIVIGGIALWSLIDWLRKRGRTT